MANTSIQVSDELLEKLKKRKLYERETYEEVIENLLEDVSELSEETKKSLSRAEKDVKAGRVHSLESIKKEFGL
jgi:predicted CopG family antitoxin